MSRRHNESFREALQSRADLFLGLGLGLGSVVMLAVVLCVILANANDSRALAAWFQAIGSIIAIYVSLNLFFRQKRVDRQSAREENSLRESRSVVALSQVLYSAMKLLKDAEQALDTSAQPGVAASFSTGRFDHLIALLDRFVDTNMNEACVAAALEASQHLIEAKAAFMPEKYRDYTASDSNAISGRIKQIEDGYERVLKYRKDQEKGMGGRRLAA